jgi:hypothetical protein
MYIAITILVSIFVLIAIARLYANRKWKLIYSAFGYEHYFRIIGKLKSEGVGYKTKTPMNFNNSDNRFNDNTQYDIYVKKEEEHLAHRALQKAN